MDPRLRRWIRIVDESGLFDRAWYLDHYADVRRNGIDPIRHYLQYGCAEGRDPSPGFHTNYYLSKHGDVARAGINPLVHYVLYGRDEGRSVGLDAAGGSGLPASIDIVIPVFNAREHVEECLNSVERNRDGFKLRIIVVDDCSDQETAAWIDERCAGNDLYQLVRNHSNMGYTRSANIGLHAVTSDFVVLLNSDTIVTPGWLEKMLRCHASIASSGIVGPLSNAASWQSVPDAVDASGKLIAGELPEGATPDRIAEFVARVSPREYPLVPFVNGFCMMLRRSMLDEISLFDQESFPVGYGEENDLCIRARDAGYNLAVADDAYVYHHKSSSFGNARREELSRAGGLVVRQKHGAKKVRRLIEQVRVATRMTDLRASVGDYLAKFDGQPLAGSDQAALRVIFLLPVRGGGGGSHSVVQEALGMRRLGVDAQVAVLRKNHARFIDAYRCVPSPNELFVAYEGSDELAQRCQGSDVIVGTIYTSMQLVHEIVDRYPGILPAYYVQDYEPMFFPEGSKQWQQAWDSYQLVPGSVLFAKTDWICRTVEKNHDVRVHRVQASVDHDVYLLGEQELDGCLNIAAMIRPSTPRRGAERTMRILSRLAAKHQGSVAVHIFGCEPDDPQLNQMDTGFDHHNHGVLDREGVAALLREMHLFLDLSDYQAFGRTALEAMACGVVPIVPCVGGADEYALDSINSFAVDPWDEAMCLAKLDDLVARPEGLPTMRARAVSTAARYSIDSAARSELWVLARELLRRRSNNRVREHFATSFTPS